MKRVKYVLAEIALGFGAHHKQEYCSTCFQAKNSQQKINKPKNDKYVEFYSNNA